MPNLAESISQTHAVRGIYLDWPMDQVPEGGLSDGQNIECDEKGVSRVSGWGKYSTAVVPGVAPVMLFADFVKANESRVALACTTTRLSKYNVATNAYEDLTGGVNLLTGTAANPIFWGALQDLFILTNGVNAIKKSDGTNWLDLGGSPPRALGLAIYEGHVLCWNVNPGTGWIGYRTQWSDLNQPEVWGSGEAGALDIREGNLLPILAGGKMRRQFLFYKEDQGGVYVMTYVGGDLVMQVEELFPRYGVFSPRAVAVHGDVHYVLGADEQIYTITPGAMPSSIGDPIRKRLFARLNWNARRACWVGVHPVKQQVYFAIPEGSAMTCTRAYIYHYPSGHWGESEWPMMAAAHMRDPESRIINELSGLAATIDGLSTVAPTIDALSVAPRQIFLLGGANGYAYQYGSAPTMDGKEIDGQAVTKWAFSGDGRMIRLRGVEVEAAGGVTVDAGIAATVDGTMSFTPLGAPVRGKADANLSGEFVAPRFRGVAPSTGWRVTGYRLNAHLRGRR